MASKCSYSSTDPGEDPKYIGTYELRVYKFVYIDLYGYIDWLPVDIWEIY